MNENLLKELCELHGVKWVNGEGVMTLNSKPLTTEDIIDAFTNVCCDFYPTCKYKDKCCLLNYSVERS